MAFVDEARVHVKGGAGGNGAVAFHREPYKPKGGPDGGNGGHGGDVVVRADESVGTLLDLRDHPHVKAEPGGHGRGDRRSGARGRDRVVLVPPGTVVYDEDGVTLADLASPGDEVVVARGGRGGFGNAHFASPTRRAPGFSEKGEPGEAAWLRLEMRLLADVGLVGFPNAGKSTLIGRISSARPKIADYPFTTLVPNLGVVKTEDESFVVADIPGLVPGAHEGRGLGDRFLRHIGRAAVLVFLVDMAATDRDPSGDVDALRGELQAFDPALATRPSLVVATKADAVPSETIAAMEAGGAHVISAVTGRGVDELVRKLVDLVGRVRRHAPRPVGYVRHVVRDQPVRVEREDGAWRVTGRAAERAVATTDVDNEEAVVRLQRKLVQIGVEKLLEQAGARAGEEVRIGDVAFDYEPENPGAAAESEGKEEGGEASA